MGVCRPSHTSIVVYVMKKWLIKKILSFLSGLAIVLFAVACLSEKDDSES